MLLLPPPPPPTTLPEIVCVCTCHLFVLYYHNERPYRDLNAYNGWATAIVYGLVDDDSRIVVVAAVVVSYVIVPFIIARYPTHNE